MQAYKRCLIAAAEIPLILLDNANNIVIYFVIYFSNMKLLKYMVVCFFYCTFEESETVSDHLKG